ncbi:HAMP domain-containing protein [Paenibacillus sp. UNCCL117]|uniref:cache domain-containing sensor histidine kinase n=1 Tax=unclassified Paenibacillus TaxID=185978 RepID=UPI00087E6E9E|nr:MULTISPECIES: sensor histidine kinase [unclassified Paenibacillus]SDD02996.1 HAMP domain-containing protein [Paenibacillus sp. cl123]SFW32389.1 HAMP domain-containing protein [Paenibacillus sp. UNCCL117]
MRAKRAGIFIKLFLSLTLASVLIFSGLLYFSLNSFKEAFYSQKTDDMSLYTERTGQFLDMYVQNVRNLLLEVSRQLDAEDMQKEPWKTEEMLARLLEWNKELISQVYVRTADGRVLTGNRLLYDTIEHPQLLETFRIVDDNPGIISWSQPYYSPMLVDETVAFALAVRDKSGRRIGIVLAEINTPQLSGQLSKLFYGQENSFVLFSEKGRLVAYERSSALLPYEQATVPKRLDASFVSRLWNAENGVNRLKGPKEALLTVKSNRNQLGWYLVTVTGEQRFMVSVREVIGRYVGISVLWFALLIVFTYFISRHFIRPLKLLALQMDRFNGELFPLIVSPEPRNDEIGDLTRSYQLLIERIRGLLETVREKEERKKESELRLLLSQIRPHFLYNTLACIGSLAKQHRAADVVETIRSLIRLLTFSIDKKTEMVTLYEELDLLKAYVQIMKIRYGDTFTLVIEVPEEDMGRIVPKMLLQPLLENALFHGVVHKEDGVIRISVRQEGETFELRVQDNGQGMTAEQLAAVQGAQTAVHDDGTRPVRQGLNGIGLSNIQERVKLLYGEEYGLAIESEVGFGTCVRVKLPARPFR